MKLNTLTVVNGASEDEDEYRRFLDSNFVFETMSRNRSPTVVYRPLAYTLTTNIVPRHWELESR